MKEGFLSSALQPHPTSALHPEIVISPPLTFLSVLPHVSHDPYHDPLPSVKIIYVYVLSSLVSCNFLEGSIYT